MRSPLQDLDCDEMVELATEYLEEALPIERRTLFEHHLVICPGCRAHMRQLRATIALARRLDEPPVPPKASADLLAMFRAFGRDGRSEGGGGGP